MCSRRGGNYDVNDDDDVNIIGYVSKNKTKKQAAEFLQELLLENSRHKSPEMVIDTSDGASKLISDSAKVFATTVNSSSSIYDNKPTLFDKYLVRV